ncbi:RluA family pseudouridine synthase [Facilibium subflavum]|uniref:RluA family pseudouridine synthase n=1 Tax=Facilibium subflavum TaxID=2219058 RepID=UPI000E645E05|nr:RluA family pseudouridine synthase [Facilibium subflavum]
MSAVQYITVDPDRTGQRIDNFLLSQFTGLPKALIYRWIRKGQLRVNKKRIKQTYRVAAGDFIRIPPFHLEEKQQNIQVTQDHLSFLESLILFENDDYMVINKPSGIAVHGGSGIQSGLIERLQQLRPQSKKLELAHRLDKETSGCLLIAKKYSILTYFHEILKNREVTKIYHALVHGVCHPKKGKIDLPLKRHLLPHGERIVRVDQNEGKQAITYIKPLNHFDQYTLIEAFPKTGRTHQIRVHLTSLSHPIVCDQKYGDPQKDKALHQLGFKRLFLHAKSLRFLDPKTQKEVSFDAPYDQACESLLNKL